MLLNYIKVAWRNLRKNKVFSLVNIAGLTLSMICSMLIFLWIMDERSYDTILPGADRAYRLVQHQQLGNGVLFKSTASPAPMPGYLKEHYPGITAYARVRPDSEKRLFSYGETKLYDFPTYVDSTFFTIFPFKMLAGNAATALMEPNSVVLTQSTAEKYFGTADALGKTLLLDNTQPYKVTGVLADLPSNTHFKFNILLPFRKLYDMNWGLGWNNNYYYGYLQLAPNADPKVLSAQIGEYARSNDDIADIFYLQPVKDAHLYSDFDIDLYGMSKERYPYLRVFWVVAILIICIACINFMNLSTARSEKRAKEIGLRKTIGARRSSIVGQLLTESLLFALLAYILALAVIYAVLPSFNAAVGKQLSLGAAQWPVLLAFFGGAVAVGLLAGSYPALVLSSFQPIRVLKGAFNPGRGGVHFRRALVVVQFAVTVVMILGTLVIYQQFRYFMNKNLGYSKDQLVYMPRQGALGKNYDAFKQELLRHPEIAGITTSSDIPTYTVHQWSGFDWDGGDKNEDVQMNCYTVGFDFIETMGFTMKEGRSFSVTHPADSFNYILNEAAVKLTGIKDPVGKRFKLWDNREGQIIGVVKDFNYKSLHQQIEPLVIRIDPRWDDYYFVRLKGGNTEAGLRLIETAWSRFNPGYPFAYQFVNNDYANLYESEKRMGTLFNYFSAFALFIACLGLFGLISFLAEKKSKEIGIRKVHGASVSNILVLLSREYLRLLLVAFCISLPLGGYLLQRWLSNFAYHASLPWWLYVLPGLIVLAVALLTVSGQVLRAARQNPVKSLKVE